MSYPTKRKKRRVCFVITSAVHYERSKILLNEIKKRKDLELQIAVGASALMEHYGNILVLMKKDGFKPNVEVPMVLEGGTSIAMAKTAGIGLSEFATVFDRLKPDIVFIRADRYEVLPIAIAASYLNIPVAHMEGGDISGNIDESVRHAVTKLAHIHFVTNKDSKKRVIQMGENPRYVFDVGCPEIEFIAKKNFKISNKFVNSLGVGSFVDIKKRFLTVIHHPVTSEIGKNQGNIKKILKSVYDLAIPAFWFWPNIDAGTNEVAEGIRTFREIYKPDNMRFIKGLPPEKFIALLKRTSCLIGNSSAGIKECSYLGIPAVNIGTRQNGRTRSKNVVDVGYDGNKIKKAILGQLEHGSYPSSNFYYKPDAGKKIADILAKASLYTQKTFHAL